mgnify:CR=1 FL=1
MLGAIIGDIVGSRFEWDNIHSKDFELFGNGCHLTDDSIMTIAIAEAIFKWRADGSPSYERLSEYAERSMRSWGLAHPDAGYGAGFDKWLHNPGMGAYNSAGNGAAMRVSPVGFSAHSLEECISMSRAVTEVTHNHPDGIKGAEATAVQIFLLRQKKDIDYIRAYEEEHYYPIGFDMHWLYENYKWSSLCDMTCQPAYLCVYSSFGFEDAIRNAISIGGDSDTLGAIAGGIAEACWGIPEDIREKGLSFLDQEMKTVLKFFSSLS